MVFLTSPKSPVLELPSTHTPRCTSTLVPRSQPHLHDIYCQFLLLLLFSPGCVYGTIVRSALLVLKHISPSEITQLGCYRTNRSHNFPRKSKLFKKLYWLQYVSAWKHHHQHFTCIAVIPWNSVHDNHHPLENRPVVPVFDLDIFPFVG